MGRLDGQTAVITGGSGGIGKTTARLFLQEGAKVSLVDVDEEALKDAKSELDAYGEVMTVTADVTEEKDVQNYVEKH